MELDFEGKEDAMISLTDEDSNVYVHYLDVTAIGEFMDPTKWDAIEERVNDMETNFNAERDRVTQGIAQTRNLLAIVRQHHAASNS
jgi:hypothetical protein